MGDESSEKQKMLAGRPYHAMDPELTKERLACRVLTSEYNKTSPDAYAKRAELLKELIGGFHKTALIEPPFRCDYGYNISFGKNFYANFDCVFLDVCKISIGENVMLGPGVHLYTATHPLDAETRITYLESGAEISIGNNVWIGGKVIVCPGVTIEDNCVIGAGSVVTKNIAANTLAAGNPAKKIRSL